MTKDLKSQLAEMSKKRRTQEEKTSPDKAVTLIDKHIFTEVAQIIELKADIEELEEMIAKNHLDSVQRGDVRALISNKYSETKEIADGTGKLSRTVWGQAFEAHRLSGSWTKAAKAVKKVRK